MTLIRSFFSTSVLIVIFVLLFLVSFPPYCALEDGSLCYSCMESNKPECSPSQETSKSLRYLSLLANSYSFGNRLISAVGFWVMVYLVVGIVVA